MVEADDSRRIQGGNALPAGEEVLGREAGRGDLHAAPEEGGRALGGRDLDSAALAVVEEARK